jgi:hypothetical protein
VEYVHEPAQDVPIIREADVVVVGGGPAGICAAVSAARNGAKTVLLEKGGFLGGNATMWLPLLSYLDVRGRHIIKGLAQEIVDRLGERGAVTRHYPCVLHESYTMFDPEVFKIVAQEMVLEAGVDVLLHTFSSGVLAEDGEVKAVLVDSKSGRAAVVGKIYVDCTGDGDIAAWAGAPFEVGDRQGLMMPPTLMFTLRNVDVKRARQALIEQSDRFKLQDIPAEQVARSEDFIAVGMMNLTAEARAKGDWTLQNDRIIFCSTTKDDEVAINMTRVPGTDGASNESLTNAELTARSQIDEIVRLLKNYVPGFTDAIIAASAHQIGVRETRRIMGDYVLTGSDVLEAVRFPDEVMLAGYMVDIHHPHDGGSTLLQPEGAHGIPYRCLLPRKLDNVLVAGRAISTTHEAQAAVRVMPPCMAMGEAAGCAAAMAVEGSITPRQVDVEALRAALRSQGVVLDLDPEEHGAAVRN